MLQALQMEKASFFGEHWHLQEDDRDPYWKEGILRMDVDTRGLPPFSAANAMNIVPTPAHSGSRMDRRIFVPTAPGIQVYTPTDLQLSQSAPANVQRYRSSFGPEYPDPSTCSHTRDDLNLNAPYSAFQSYTGLSGSPHSFGRAGSPGSDGSVTFENGIDSPRTDTTFFGPMSHNQWTPAYLGANDLQSDHGLLVPNQRDNFTGLLLNASSLSSPGTGEVPLSPMLADSTFASRMNGQNRPMSSTSLRGGADLHLFASNISNSPHVDNCGDISLPFSYPPSVAANNSTFSLMESENSRFVSNSFHISSEDALSLSTFAYSDFVCSHAGTDLVVDDWSVPIEGLDGFKTDNDSPAIQQRRDATAVKSSRRITPIENDGHFGYRQVYTPQEYEPVESPRGVLPMEEGVVQTHDGKRKYAISRASYNRPKYARKICDQCSEHPEGFRGDHELKRHIERAHTIKKKMWVCIERSPGGTFLANCRRCRSMKMYGAYYNAAAHLRRAHFNKRTKGRREPDQPAEKRGGIGGGKSPSMEILKHWMKEVEMPIVPDSKSSESPPSFEDSQFDDTYDTPEEDQPFDSYQSDYSAMPCDLGPNLAPPPHEVSSYPSQQYNSCQTTQPPVEDTVWVRHEPGYYNTPWLERIGSSFDLSTSDPNPYSSYSSRRPYDSEMEQQISSAKDFSREDWH